MDEQITIPTWLARSLVPAALIGALVASFNMWLDVNLLGRQFKDLEPRIAEFEKFRLRGGRFTAEDGDKLRQKYTELERRLDRLEFQRKYDHRGSKP